MSNSVPLTDVTREQIGQLIVDLLADSSGNQREDISAESNLTRELNLTQEDIIRLIKHTEKTFNTQYAKPNPLIAPISLDGLLEPSELEEMEIVADVVEAVYNEVELG